MQLSTNSYWKDLLLRETGRWLHFASAHKEQLLQSRTQDHNGSAGRYKRRRHGFIKRPGRRPYLVIRIAVTPLIFL